MIRKGTRLFSMFHHRCPQCHEGELFINKAYSKNFTDMPQRCEHCGLHYEQEPSFFTGAMYVSYAINVALFTSVYVALRVLFDPKDVNVYILSSIATSIVLLPITLRLSRAIYLNFFFSFKPAASKQRESS